MAGRKAKRLLALTAAIAGVLSIKAGKTYAQSTQYWDGDTATAGDQYGPGVWDLNTSNWFPDLTYTTDGLWVQGNNAVFGGTQNSSLFNNSNTDGLVFLGTNITAGTITFNTLGYEVAGYTNTLGYTPNVLTLNGGSVVVNTSGEISAPIAGSGFTVTGGGLLGIYQNNTFNGNVIVQGGSTLDIINTTSFGAATNGVVLDGGTLTVARFAQLGSNPIIVTTNGGTLDLTNIIGGQYFFTGSNALQIATGATLTKYQYGIMNIVTAQNTGGNLVMGDDSGTINVEGGANGTVGSFTNNSLNVVIGLDDVFGVDNQNSVQTDQFPGFGQGGTSNTNRIADGITFTLNTGELSYSAANLAGQNREIFGTVTLSSGLNRLNSFSGGQGSDMQITNLVVSEGAGVLFNSGTYGGTPGTNARIDLEEINGVAPTLGSFLGGWATGPNDFMYMGAGTAGVEVYTGNGPNYTNTFAAGNVTMGSTVAQLTIPSGGATTGALKLQSTGATGITYGAANTVLTLQSGGLLIDNTNRTVNIGTAALPGVIEVGGGASTAFQSNQLDIYQYNTGTTNINSKLSDNGTNSMDVSISFGLQTASASVYLLNTNNSYTGGTYIQRLVATTSGTDFHTVYAIATNTLSTGNVFVNNGLLNYGPGAHTASGTNAIFVLNGSMLESQTSTSLSGTNNNADTPLNKPGDRFYIDSTSQIQLWGTNQLLGLTRVSSLATNSGGGVIQFAPGALVRLNPSPGSAWAYAPNFGTSADLYLGVLPISGASYGSNPEASVTVGAGTSWEGLSADISTGDGLSSGTIYANSSFVLKGNDVDNAGGQGTQLKVGSAANAAAETGTIGIVSNTGQPITVSIQNYVELYGNKNNISNLVTFDVQPGANFYTYGSDIFGTDASNASNNATIIVEQGGYLQGQTGFGGALDAFNGNVYFRPGAQFLTVAPTLAGIGTFYFEPGSVFQLIETGNLTGSQPLDFSPGAIIEFQTANPLAINTSVVGPSPVYEMGGSFAITSQSTGPETINLNSQQSILTNDLTSRNVLQGYAPIIVGNSGTIEATTGTLLGIYNYLDFGTNTTITFGGTNYVDGDPKAGLVGIFTPFNSGPGALTFAPTSDGLAVGYNNNNLTQQSLPHTASVVTQSGGGDLVVAYPEIEVITHLTGNGIVSDTGINNGTAGTLDVGYGNASSTFSGTFNNTYGLSPNVTQIGTGTFTINGGNTASNTAGTLTVAQGAVVINGTGNVGFATDMITPGGTLTLDNSGTSTSNRLGVGNTLDMAGGTLNVIGGSGNVVETLGTITDSSLASGGGASVINYTAGAGSVIFNVGTLAGVSNTPTASILINDNVGSASSNSAGSFSIFATTPNLQNGQPTNTGTTYVGVRPDIIVNNGGALNFATYDPTFGLRALNSNEMASYNLSTIQGVITGTNGVTSDNMLLSSAQNITGDAITMSLTLNSGASISGSSSSEIRLGVRSGGILVQNGNSTISTPWIDTYGNSDLMLYTAGNLTINSTINDAYGIEKSGTGTLSLGSGALSAMAGALAINQGATVLGANNSVPFDFWAATGRAFYVNGGSLDLNGNNEVMFGLYSNAYPGAGGLLTNSSTTGAVVTLAGTTSAPFGGTIGGNIELDKAGSSNFTITTPQTYTGLTYVRQGTLTLRDSGSITSSAGIIVQGNSTFVVENNQSISDLPTRTGSVPITIASGTLQVDGASGAGTTGATFNTVNINAGAAFIDSRAADYGTNIVTISNLNVNANGVVDFRGNGNLLALGVAPGSSGSMNLATPLIDVGNLNGSSLASYNGFMGGWGVVNENDFAAYNGTNSGGYGVGAYGQSGFASYTNNNGILNDSGTVVNIPGGVAGVQSGGDFAGALRLQGAAGVIFAGTNADVLNIESGGLLGDNSNSYRFVGTQTLTTGGVSGSLSAGGASPSGPATLYASFNAGTNVIFASIIDNTNGATAPLTLVKALSGSLTLANINSFTGGTIVEGGTLNLSATNATNTSVTASIPGNLTIIGTGTVTETVGKQFSPTSTITFNEGGTVNTLLNTTETIQSITFDGGNGSGPGLNIGSVNGTSGSVLMLSASNAVNVTADNVTDIGHINNGNLKFTAANPIINIGGTAILGLTIGATIDSANEIVKTGTGGLVLAPGSASSAWTSGLDIQQGLVAVNNVASINAGNFFQVDAGGQLALESTGAAVGTVILNGGTVFGGGTAANAADTVGTLNVSSNGGTVQLYNGADPASGNPLSTSLKTLGGLTGGSNAVLNLTGPSIANLGSTLIVTGNSTYTGTINVAADAQLELLGTVGLPSMVASIALNGGTETGIPGAYGTNIAAILKLNDDAAGSTGATVTFNDSVTMTGNYVNFTADRAATSTANTLALAQVTVGNQYVTASSADSYSLQFNNTVFSGGSPTFNVVASNLILNNMTNSGATLISKTGAGQLTFGAGGISSVFATTPVVAYAGTIQLGADPSGGTVTLDTGLSGTTVVNSNLTIVPTSATLTTLNVNDAYTPQAVTLNLTNLTIAANNGFGTPAALTLSNSTALNSSFTANNGQYTASAGTASLGAVTGSGTMTLSPASGTMLTMVTNIQQSAVTVNAGAFLGVASNVAQATNTIASLTITGSGQLDVANQYLLTNTSPSTIRSYLINGYNAGAWNGTGGISSINAAANVGQATALGYTSGTSSVGMALGLTTGQTLVKYTIYGDANLDGKVDISDLNIVLSNFASGKPPTWDTGDFTYAGQTDISDLNIVLSHYSQSAPTTIATPSTAHSSVKAAAANSVVSSGPQTLTGAASPSVALGSIALDVNSITGDAVMVPTGNPDVVDTQEASSSGNLLPNNWMDLSNFYGVPHWDDVSVQTINLAEYDASYISRHNFLTMTAPIDYGDIFNTSGPRDLTFEYGIADTDGTDVDTETGLIVYSQVPEPTTLSLMGLAAAGLLARRRRKEQK